jgi:H+/Cl- antiporter ClcA
MASANADGQGSAWRRLAADRGVPTVARCGHCVLVEFVFPAARGSGLNQTKAAMYIHDGYISLRTMFGKLICTSLALGGGFAQGPEDPSLQIGAAIASTVSRRFRLSSENLRLFAPVARRRVGGGLQCSDYGAAVCD